MPYAVFEVVVIFTFLPPLVMTREDPRELREFLEDSGRAEYGDYAVFFEDRLIFAHFHESFMQ